MKEITKESINFLWFHKALCFSPQPFLSHTCKAVSRHHSTTDISEKKSTRTLPGQTFNLLFNATGMKNSEKEEIPYPPLLPSKVDLRQVTIIPHAEWERIRDSLGRLTREAAALRAERTAKKKMHIQSQELVKHWTNTYAVSISPLEDACFEHYLRLLSSVLYLLWIIWCSNCHKYNGTRFQDL